MKQHRPLILGIFVAVLVLAAGVAAVLIIDAENEQADLVGTQQNQATDEDGVSATETITTDTTSLASEYLSSYTIDETEYGTQVTVNVDEQAGTRTIMRNALPNHDTGEFPNSGNPNEIGAQDFEEEYTLNPTYTGQASFARTIGIAINGVKFEPDTAERAVCSDGTQHNIEAIQNVTNLGLDFNNAHVQPTGEYHYHGVSELLVDLYSTDQDLVHVGFAADGFLMYYSKSGAYTPGYRLGSGVREGTNCTYSTPGPNGGDAISFDGQKDGSLKSDWDFDASYGDLDECNGIEIQGTYVYLITDTYPFVGRCLQGQVTAESAPAAGAATPGSNGQSQAPPPRQ